MSVPLNTTRNKECSLRSLEIRYPAYWLFWYSSSAPQRSVTAPRAHARINTVTCFVQNASLIEAPAQQQWHQVPSSYESSPFPTGVPEGATHPCCPFPKVQAFYISGHMKETRDRGQCGCLSWRETPNRSPNRENCVWFALCGSGWYAVSLQEACLLPSTLMAVGSMVVDTRHLNYACRDTFATVASAPRVELTQVLLSSCYLCSAPKDGDRKPPVVVTSGRGNY